VGKRIDWVPRDHGREGNTDNGRFSKCSNVFASTITESYTHADSRSYSRTNYD
jgi:hypothetical protein